MINELKKGRLLWLPEVNIGYYEVCENPYGLSYFQRYQEMAKTELGLALNKVRVDLVNKYTKGFVCDVGIGSGLFVESRDRTYGYDVNNFAVEWLVKKDLYCNPYNGCENATFWDSLEHIKSPNKLLKHISGYAFVSIPIFNNGEHILKSKHYRKDEHFWYFTHESFIYFMQMNGFEFIESNKMEIELGREDIGTFVFRKYDAS